MYPLIVLELVFLVDLVALFVPRRLRFAAERSRQERLARGVGIVLRFPLPSDLSAASVLRRTAPLFALPYISKLRYRRM